MGQIHNMIRLLEEATTTLRRTANQGVDRRKKDIYFEMSRKMNATLQAMQEQQRNLKQIAMMSDDARDIRLAETFQQMARKMNQEMQEAENVMCQMKNIANN